MNGRVVSARGDDAGNQAFGLLEAARLIGNQIQQMPVTSAIWLALQKSAQKGFRNNGGSSLKVGQRLFQEYRG